MTDEIPTIPEFFKGRSIFITGASGFMGKVLVEKLLRSCPDLKKVYLLLRKKKGMDLETRLQKMVNIPLFDRLRTERPGIIEKRLHLIHGDVKELNLGLSIEDEILLQDEVSVIFHVAASVRFDDPLKDAVLLNTRGTRETINLGTRMKNLEVLLHVSTTYCNTDKREINEQVYPPHADWRETIDVVERAEQNILKMLTLPFIYPLSNTYTFAKSLAEHVVQDLCKDKIPAVIFRPSIVISSLHEPIPGWIDNFNGPVGLLAASGVGIMRTVYTDPKVISDYIPVDVAIKAMIVAAWKKAVYEKPTQKKEVSVYNCSSNGVKSVTLAEVIAMAKETGKHYPLNKMLWAPGGGITSCKTWHLIRFWFLHLVPAILADIGLKLSGNLEKFSLIKLQRKIYIANSALEYFITNQWEFRNKKFLGLQKEILKEDLPDWDFDFSEADVFNYFEKSIIGAKQYLLKEKMEDLPKARKGLQRMVWLDRVTKLVFGITFLYILQALRIPDLLLYILMGFVNYFRNLVNVEHITF